VTHRSHTFDLHITS